MRLVLIIYILPVLVRALSVLARSAGGKQRGQWIAPTLSKSDIGQGLYQTVLVIGTRVSGYPSWLGVDDSTEGRIHWRRPTAIVRFSLATRRGTIHSDNDLSGCGGELFKCSVVSATSGQIQC